MEEATGGGRYGQWYIQGKLYRANEHEDIMELRKVLDNAASSNLLQDDTSVLDVIPPHLQALAKVSFGNTAGCTDLSQVSAMMVLHHFEQYWEEHEEPGDYFLDVDLVGRMVQDLSSPSSSTTNTCQLLLQHSVQSIAPLNQKSDDDDVDWDDTSPPLVLNVMVSTGGEQQQLTRITADSVVVTVPPHLWPQMLHPTLLCDERKRRAMQYVGMDQPAIKIVCQYQSSCWDPQLQQLICLDDCLIPEIWFDGTTAVGFLMSEFARTFPVQDDTRSDEAVQILTRQLSQILQVPLERFLPVEYSCTIWKQGGYMFPRVGMTPADLQALASSSQGQRMHFAGEATHTGACCTIQAAMETGYRAADEILQRQDKQLQ
jgi:Flavin containing amine oxidoreductase